MPSSLWLSTDNSGVGNGGMTRMAVMAMVMAMGGASRSREVGGGCVIVPNGNWEEKELGCGRARQLTCTFP